MDPFDPAEHTVAEVLAYIEEHPEEAEAVRAAEASGKARQTVLKSIAGPDAPKSPNRVYRGDVERYFPTLVTVDAEGTLTVGVLLKPGDTVMLADPTVINNDLQEA
jgi:hypothetical protein